MQLPKTKILHIITKGEWGGAQRYVFDLATNLSQNFDVTLAVGEMKGRPDLQDKIERLSAKGGSASGGKDCKITIIQLKHMVRSISPIHDVLAILELAKLYKTLGPDIVHLNSSKAGITGSIAMLLQIKNNKLKIIYTVHGWIFNEPTRKIGRWLYRFLEKFTARWKDKIIVLSEQDFLSGKQLGIPEKKLVKIPLGIEMPKFLDREEARKKIFSIIKQRDSSVAALPQNDKYIGTTANLYKTKGLDVLIEAVNDVVNVSAQGGSASGGENVKFVVIGEGPERKNLESLIKKYHLENTVFLIGAVDNAAQYLRAFDLFVLPSRKEGLPYTLLEAAAGKIPVVATDVGGVPSLIENKKTGLLIQSENSRKLTDALLYALENPTKMRQMAEHAHLHNLEEMIKQTTSLYLIR